MSDYADFLGGKAQLEGNFGFEPVWLPEALFDFQESMVTWACRKGRAALFEDCGLGKGLQELVFGENVVRHTNGNVLLKAPLAVAGQLAREAQKFGIEAHYSRDGKIKRGINITNYERLHLFDSNDFVGTMNDESSILKNFEGARRDQITEFDRKLPYRLLGTATAAPNDYIELGTSSEALGYLGHMDMLNRYFKNDLNNSATGRMRGEVIKWRLKGHAREPYWRYVCSWARAMRKPSDLGFDDGAFKLPALEEVEHLVDTETLADGFLFALPAAGLKEQREERRRTLRERCEKAAELILARGETAVAWCDLNDEGDLLERLLPGAVQVSGKDSDDEKEEKLLAFSLGQIKHLVTKQKIAGFGMNWQHCGHATTFPSNSYEGYYQLVRRFWRFGRTEPVRVDIVTTEGGRGQLRNMQRKAAQADVMFAELISHMSSALAIDRARAFTQEMELPTWL